MGFEVSAPCSRREVTVTLAPRLEVQVKEIEYDVLLGKKVQEKV